MALLKCTALAVSAGHRGGWYQDTTSKLALSVAEGCRPRVVWLGLSPCYKKRFHSPRRVHARTFEWVTTRLRTPSRKEGNHRSHQRGPDRDCKVRCCRRETAPPEIFSLVGCRLGGNKSLEVRPQTLSNAPHLLGAHDSTNISCTNQIRTASGREPRCIPDLVTPNSILLSASRLIAPVEPEYP
jgi:hypothetical protein